MRFFQVQELVSLVLLVFVFEYFLISNKVNQKSEYYNKIGNLKFNAKNYGEAFWYYKTAYLFNPTDEIKNTIVNIYEKLNSLNNKNDISLRREIDSITNFLAFIRAK